MEIAEIAVIARDRRDRGGRVRAALVYRAPLAEALFAFATLASVAVKNFVNWSRTILESTNRPGEQPGTNY